MSINIQFGSQYSPHNHPIANKRSPQEWDEPICGQKHSKSEIPIQVECWYLPWKEVKLVGPTVKYNNNSFLSINDTYEEITGFHRRHERW